MPKLTRRTSRLCLDKNSGQGVVRINGRKIYLGRYGTSDCQANYDRIISEWLANDRKLPSVEVVPTGFTINDLILEFWKHAENWYVKDGKPTSALHCYKMALRPIRDLHGSTPVHEFGPLSCSRR